MPHSVVTIVYGIDELDPRAREHARDWYRRYALDDDWYGFLFEDFVSICAILGVSLKWKAVRLHGGGTLSEAVILFSGFSSQGDGACFEGDYRYATGSRRRIREHAPQDDGLHAIADRLFDVQRRNFYRLDASVRHAGRYYHEYAMSIAVSQANRAGDVRLDDEERVIEALRDLARWLYRQLEAEYDYQMADAQVDEALRSQAFTFTSYGQRFG